MDYNDKLINVFEELFNQLYNYDNLNKTLKGRLLELITCIKYNCVMYEDINKEYKLKHNLSIKDDGIDCIDINNKMIFQCKFYQSKTYLSKHDLGTFFDYCLSLDDFKFYLVCVEGMKLPKMNKKINIDIIKINEMKEYVINAYSCKMKNNGCCINDKIIKEIEKNIEYLFNGCKYEFKIREMINECYIHKSILTNYYDDGLYFL